VACTFALTWLTDVAYQFVDRRLSGRSPSAPARVPGLS